MENVSGIYCRVNEAVLCPASHVLPNIVDKFIQVNSNILLPIYNPFNHYHDVPVNLNLNLSHLLKMYLFPILIFFVFSLLYTVFFFFLFFIFFFFLSVSFNL